MRHSRGTRRFFIRRYFKSRLTFERGACERSRSLLRDFTVSPGRARGVSLSGERPREEERRGGRRTGVKKGSGVCEEFARRYGTVVILKTIIRASGGRPQVSQGRTVTAISIASQ